jgi:signal transduction histidine kinase
LLELGLIDRQTLDQAITEQIMQLRAALQETNRQLEQRVQERTAELQNALNKLSELNQLKSNIVANISHELRTPLTHIKGYLELLIAELMGPLSPEQVGALEVMQRSTERLERQIEDLILFSIASRGEFSLRLTSINVGA